MNSSSTEGRQWQQPINARAVETAHLVQLAMTPGWWQHSRLRAMELEEESVTHGHGLYLGIRAAVKAELQRLQFKPHPSELESLSWAQTPKPPCTPKAA